MFCLVNLASSPLTTLSRLTPLQPHWPSLLFPQQPTSGPLHMMVPPSRTPDLPRASSLSFKAFPDHPSSNSHSIRSLFYFLHNTNYNLKLEIYLVFKKRMDVVIYFLLPAPRQFSLPHSKCELREGRDLVCFYSLLNPQHLDPGLARNRCSANFGE